MKGRSSDLLWTVMSFIVDDGATWREVKAKARRSWKGLAVALVLLAATLAVSFKAEAAQAHGDVDCYRNGREIPPDQCAWQNMVVYAQQTYYLPSMQSFWVNPTPHGRWHSRWAFYGVYPAIDLSYFTLSARRCNGHMITYDRRRDVNWPHGC